MSDLLAIQDNLLKASAEELLMYLDNGFDDDERSDFGVNIPLSRLSMLPNSI